MLSREAESTVSNAPEATETNLFTSRQSVYSLRKVSKEHPTEPSNGLGRTQVPAFGYHHGCHLLKSTTRGQGKFLLGTAKNNAKEDNHLGKELGFPR